MSQTSTPNTVNNANTGTSVTTTIQKALTKEDMIEMLKNLASVNEKMHKWEQSLKKLDNYPSNDTNKLIMNDIIEFINQDKSTSHEKAIYLYGQLAQKCTEQSNYMGAAKAFERAATLRFESPTVKDEVSANNAKMTIQYLESAIMNYDSMNKHKHAGTLHYRISRIMRLINAPPEQVAKHYNLALEYYIKRDQEVKHRLVLEGKKVSCFSTDYSNNLNKELKRKYSVKYADSDEYQTHSKYGRYVDETGSEYSDTYDYYPLNNAKQVDIYGHNSDVSHKSAAYRKTSHFSGPKQCRRIEDRIESAKKLVKKLHKFCPYYEVRIDGEDAGRVFCNVCERHLGAVSSTLKNHVNTQEHKQALEESTASNAYPSHVRHNDNKVANNVVVVNTATTSSATTKSFSNSHHHIQQQINSGNNGLDFGEIDIQWVSGFQSPVASVDYSINNINNMCDNSGVAVNANHSHSQVKSITNL